MAWTDKYVDLGVGSGGSGTTGDPWGSYGAAITGLGTIGGPTRVFVRGDGSLSGVLTFNSAGTSGANPLRWIGCTGSGTTWTEIGNDASTTKPLLTQGTYGVDITTAFQSFEGLGFTSTVSATYGTVRINAADCMLKRCRIANTNNYYAFRNPAGGTKAFVVGCHLSSSGSSNIVVEMVGSYSVAFGNYITGGSKGIYIAAGGGAAAHNVVVSSGDVGIDLAAGGNVIKNTIVGPGSHGIQSSRVEPYSIAGNLIVNATGSGAYPIRYTTTASSAFRPVGNAWYNVTNNSIQGLVEDWAEFNIGLLGADPFTNAAGGDYSLTSAAKELGWPGAFENTSLVGYQDIGALGRQEPTGGGGTVYVPQGGGGFGVWRS